MIEQPSLPQRIEAWTREAVEAWGDDWTLICAHIERRMNMMATDERRGLAVEAALTLVGVEQGARH